MFARSLLQMYMFDARILVGGVFWKVFFARKAYFLFANARTRKKFQERVYKKYSQGWPDTKSKGMISFLAAKSKQADFYPVEKQLNVLKQLFKNLLQYQISIFWEN